MDIDKLFKVPKLPKVGNKRRMPDAPPPDMLKRMRLSADDAADANTISGPASNTGLSVKLKPPNVTQEEVEEDSGQVDNEFAPGGDADYFVDEDEDGRFFGGGLTNEQKDILNIFDNAGGELGISDNQLLNPTSVRKVLLKLERTSKKNSDQRSKYPDDPTKFIDSEADLDAAIKALLPLAQAPNVTYPELIKSGQVELLVGLLSHENTDIVLDVIELFHELTDEDVNGEADDDENVGETEDREVALKDLINVLLSHSILELLVDNLVRFDESEEADRQGIFHVLGIFENIVSSEPSLAERLSLKTNILPWLLNRIQAEFHDDNRGYASELLSILLQESRPSRLKLGEHDGIETLLKAISRFRKRDLPDADEVEFMENLFNSLCSSLGETENKKLFLDSEGIDLMVLILKDGTKALSCSIKALDFAMSGPNGSEACEVFIQATGLKYIFRSLMGKRNKKQNVTTVLSLEDTAHILSIISSLFSNLPSDSNGRIRLLAKLVENNYEKTDKLLDVRATAQARLATVDREITIERKIREVNNEDTNDDQEDAWYMRRLDGGLYILQTVDYILAWALMEDDGIREHAKQMLDRRNVSFKDIAFTLQTFYDNVDENEMKQGDASIGLSQRQILGHLIEFLEAC